MGSACEGATSVPVKSDETARRITEVFMLMTLSWGVDSAEAKLDEV
jgi:hypothetical protein